MAAKKALSRFVAAAIAAPVLVVPLALGAASPAAAASVSTLADFEAGAPAGFFAYGNAGFGVIDVEPGSPDAREGQTETAGVLSYGFDVAPPGSFGGVGHNFATSGDWSDFEGVSFWLRGAGTGAQLQFEIFDGGANADASERFDYTITDDTAGWREVQIPWASFTRSTDFQPEGAPDDGLGLTTMWGYALPAVAGTATVLADDIALYSATDVTPTATLAAATYEVLEGTSAEVQVRLNVAPTAPVTIEYATGDDADPATTPATEGDDYAASAGTLTFAPGVTTQWFPVDTIDDDAEEPNETLAVTLSTPAGAGLGTPSTAVLTILDNDAAPTGPPTGRTLLVEDFEAPLPVGTDGTVPVGWFAAQDPASTVAFATTDTPPAPVPSDEPAPGNTVLSATYDVQAFGVVVNNLTNESATEWTPQDWSTYEGIGFWMHGTGSGTQLFLDLIDNRNPDSTTDDAERFVVDFADNWTGWRFQQFDFADFTRKNINNGAPNDGLTLTELHGFAFGSLATATDAPLTLHVDDVLLYGTAAPVPLTVGFDRAGYEVTEGADAVAAVRLNRASDAPVTVDFTTAEAVGRTATEDPPATLGRDFVSASGTLTIPAGEREATIAVPTLQNAKHEVDETFLIELAGPTGAEFGFVSTATVSIQDDEPIDPALVDDFEAYPWLFDTEGDVDLAVREIPGGDDGEDGTGDGYAGQDIFEGVLDVTHDGSATLGRDFAQGQDWSAYEGLSFWYQGEGDGDTVTMTLADGAADTGATANPDAWVQTWGDEFDGPAGARANPDNWTYETGGWGWGNDELQYYTDSTDNAALDGNGNLVITTREIDPATTELECWYGPCTHTSARLITEQKQEFSYGRIESRVQVPQGSGIWPAVWALGSDFREVGWPQTGEIDIMEFVGRLPNEVFGTIHGPGYSGGASFGDTYEFDGPVYDDWHTFSVEWTPGQINWFVDGIQFHSASPADVAPNEWVFDHPFSLITNVAVGGNFGGQIGDDLVFPQSLTVDYIRVFQAPDTAERFETTFIDDEAGWRQVTVPFADLTRSADQPAGAPRDGLTLTDVQGYAFEFAGSGTVSLDRVYLEEDVAATPVDPGPIDPGPVDPGPVDPGPVAPGPVDPVTPGGEPDHPEPPGLAGHHVDRLCADGSGGAEQDDGAGGHPIILPGRPAGSDTAHTS